MLSWMIGNQHFFESGTLLTDLEIAIALSFFEGLVQLHHSIVFEFLIQQYFFSQHQYATLIQSTVYLVDHLLAFFDFNKL